MLSLFGKGMGIGDKMQSDTPILSLVRQILLERSGYPVEAQGNRTMFHCQ